MILQEVNTIALATAAELVVGPEAAQRIAAVYTYIDRVMKGAYDLGKYEAEQRVEQRMDAAFDEGFINGQQQAEKNSETSWDHGYLDGVGDARARPGLADQTVADIVADLDQHALNSVDVEDGEGKHNASPEGADWDFDPSEYMADYVQDSGDETPAATTSDGWDAEIYRVRKGDIG
jgi:hypothetical protein